MTEHALFKNDYLEKNLPIFAIKFVAVDKRSIKVV